MKVASLFPVLPARRVQTLTWDWPVVHPLRRWWRKTMYDFLHTLLCFIFCTCAQKKDTPNTFLRLSILALQIFFKTLVPLCAFFLFF